MEGEPTRSPAATLKQVADHIEHVRDVAGVDHVGIGSDFDGIDTVPQGLEDVSKFPAAFCRADPAGLERRRSEEAGRSEPAARVPARAEATAARLQKTRQPSTRTIEELDGKGKA